jgi:hypothetical protein
MKYKEGFTRCQCSAQPPAQKTVGQIEKETLLSHISIFLVVGAVCNRDL